jgi:hypothetical protein
MIEQSLVQPLADKVSGRGTTVVLRYLLRSLADETSGGVGVAATGKSPARPQATMPP